jgi:hypothetical protein
MPEYPIYVPVKCWSVDRNFLKLIYISADGRSFWKLIYISADALFRENLAVLR